MSKHSKRRHDLKNSVSNSIKPYWLISIIVIMGLFLFAPDLLNVNYDPAILDDEEAIEIVEQFNGSNFEILPTLTRIPIEYRDVNDGDTIVASLNNHEFSVRYLMIDTPEMNYNQSQDPEPYAEEARELNTSLLRQANQVYMELDVGPIMDDYDRVLAYVYADDVLISEAIIAEGLGTVRYVNPPNNSYENLLRNAEDLARQEEINIWSN